MAAPTRVQHFYGHNAAGGASSTQAFGVAVTTGNVVVLAVEWVSSTATLTGTGITKSAGAATIGTVTKVDLFATSGFSGAYVWFPVTVGGSLTLQLDLSAGANHNYFGWELSGADASTPVHQAAGARISFDADGTNDPADGTTTPAVTTTVSDCLILAFITANSQTLSAGGNPNVFTLQQNIVGTAGGTDEYFVQTAAGAITPTFTRTAGGAVSGAAVTLAVQPTVAATGVTWLPVTQTVQGKAWLAVSSGQTPPEA